MIKKGTKVKVLTGKDKNKDGEVIEIDFLNFVITGFCPAIFARSSSHDFKIFWSFPSTPKPIFSTTFCNFGDM